MDLPDAPTKVARGAALGLAFDFLPIPIISIPIAYIVARLVGGNGLAGALTAACFKLAVPFFYILNVATGNLLLSYNLSEETLNMTAMHSPQLWLKELAQLGIPFIVGAMVNAVIAWLVVYFLVQRLLFVRRKRKGIKHNEMDC